MDIYIKKEDAIKACFDGFADCRDDCADNIRRLPAEDVAPIIHGCWEKYDDDNDIWNCSSCRMLIGDSDGNPSQNGMNFCPYCGAKMDKVNKDE